MKTPVMRIIMLFSMLLFGCAPFISQQPILEQPVINNQSNTQPRFSVLQMNLINPLSPEQSALLIFIKIPYSELTFVKIDTNRWQASYNIDTRLTFENSSEIIEGHFPGKTNIIIDPQVAKNPWLYVLRILKYEEQEPHAQMDIKVTDKINGKSSSLGISVNKRLIKPNSFDISDLLFIAPQVDGKKFLDALFNTSNTAELKIIPINPQTLDPWQPVKFVFEICYPPQPQFSDLVENVVIEYKLLFKQNVVLENKEVIEITQETPQKQIIEIQFSLPEDLGNGNYNLVIQAYTQNLDTEIPKLTSHTVTKSIQFYSPIPRSKKEMSDILGAMRYVAHHEIPKVMKSIKKAKGDKEKMKIFYKFWEKQGPGALEEYYRRIQHAKQYYSGIHTDQGKTCIRFGIPTEFPNWIDERFFLFGYHGIQFWHYPKFNAVNSFYFVFPHKTFIFVDELGVGTYTFGRSFRFGYRNSIQTVIHNHNMKEFSSY